MGEDSAPLDGTTEAQQPPPGAQEDGAAHRRRRGNRTSFKPGNKAYRGGSKKRARKSPLYRDYEYVWTHQNGPFRDDSKRELKKYLEEDRRGFLQQYAQLEKAWLAKTEKVVDPLSAGGKDAPSLDEGTERCIELVERWLREHSASEAEHGEKPQGENTPS
jgi:hypothetical protein